MASQTQIATALLTEHFRYTPLTLLDDVINTVNELIFRAVNAIEDGLINIDPQSLGWRPFQPSDDEATLKERQRTEVETGVVQLESLLNATVDKDFDKFEIYVLRNIMCVSHAEEGLENWVRLDHYKDLQLPVADDGPTPEEVQRLRRKVQESGKLNALLKAEQARNDALLQQLRGLVGVGGRTEGQPAPFAFLRDSPHASTKAEARPLEQNTQYAVSQLPALRSLLQSLKGGLHTLLKANFKGEIDDSAKTERRQYVDSQSRRALERRGMDPDAHASTASGLGRRVGREEVEGLETIVQVLSGAEKKRHEDKMEE